MNDAAPTQTTSEEQIKANLEAAQAFLPAAQPVSQFDYASARINATAILSTTLRVNTPLQLTRRNIYVGIIPELSTNNGFIQCTLNFYNGSNRICTYPFATWLNTYPQGASLNQSLPVIGGLPLIFGNAASNYQQLLVIGIVNVQVSTGGPPFWLGVSLIQFAEGLQLLYPYAPSTIIFPTGGFSLIVPPVKLHGKIDGIELVFNASQFSGNSIFTWLGCLSLA